MRRMGMETIYRKPRTSIPARDLIVPPVPLRADSETPVKILNIVSSGVSGATAVCSLRQGIPALFAMVS